VGVVNIFMITNTFVPHVGGVARSVQRFTETYRSMGHDVTVVAPGVLDAAHGAA
jgi:1,2-diacylglycerol 3-alpha-glucosyltransferase